MSATRAMQPSDLPYVVAIHRAAFPNFFLSFLGPRFLHVFYAFVIREGIAVVATEEGRVAGFAAGATDPDCFYRLLLQRRVVPLTFALAPVILRRPSTLMRVARRAHHRTGHGHGTPAGTELMSLAVDPSRVHRGIGRGLVAAFAARAAAAGSSNLWLTTDAAENAGVIRFYERLGFQQSRSFTTGEGRAMIELMRIAECAP